MLLEEFVNLDEWLSSYETNFGAIRKLQELQQILQANASNQNQPFTDQKNQAVSAIAAYKVSELTRDQIECLKLYDGFKYMGPEAADNLSTLFKEEGYDIAYLHDEIQKAHSSLANTKSNIANAAKTIHPFSEVIVKSEYLSERARFSIIFKDGVGVDSLKDLEIRSHEWSDIMYLIGRALHVPAEDFKVLGARNGSFIVDLYMVAAAMPAIVFILYASFDVIERFALSLKRVNKVFSSDIDDPDFKEVHDQITSASEKYFDLK